MKKLFYLFLCAFSFTLAGCGNGNTPDEPNDPSGPDTPQSSEECTMTSKIVQAHTVYEVTFKSGEKIWCGVINEVDAPTKLSLVSAYAYYSDNDIWKKYKYKGDYTIPSSFKCNGVTYTITELYGANEYYAAATPFYQCDELTSVTIPSTVTTIGSRAFAKCYNLKNVTLPESVTEIGSNAFSEDSSIVSLHLPASVKTIGGSAFDRCYGLATINLPEGLTAIKSNTFSNCRSLTSISIPQTVSTIESEAFYGCSLLNSVVVSEGLQELGSGAFSRCNTLTSISLPSTMTKIGYAPFERCSALTALTCKATTPPSLDSHLGIDELSTIVYVPSGSVDAYKNNYYWKQFKIQAMP